MRIDKLTTSFQQALGAAQSIAVGKDNANLDPLHVLHALISEDNLALNPYCFARAVTSTNFTS